MYFLILWLPFFSMQIFHLVLLLLLCCFFSSQMGVKSYLLLLLRCPLPPVSWSALCLWNRLLLRRNPGSQSPAPLRAPWQAALNVGPNTFLWTDVFYCIFNSFLSFVITVSLISCFLSSMRGRSDPRSCRWISHESSQQLPGYHACR